ncbi:hypothetical protein ACFX2I_037334 [Malus domestica]
MATFALSACNMIHFPLAVLAYFTLLTLANSHGFTADLIHRDSPLSPWYNSSVSRYDRLHNAFRRSVTRANHFVKPIITSLSSSSSANIQSRIISSAGEYLMNVSIGTPPVEVLGIADTGSDLIWTQCKPCKQCFNQNPPLFDPKKSSTYGSIPCQSNSCTYLEEASCSTEDNEGHETCDYSYHYGDRSFTRGTLAVETFTIGSTSGRPVSLPKILFGCGHQNGGTFDESGSGLIGLGGGPLSLVSQLTKSTNGGKFSYCLVPLASNSKNSNNNLASKISFGSAGIVSGAGAVSTPIVAKQPDTFYYLTLEAISVGEKRLAYKTKSSPNFEDDVAVAANEGNIIIDSGTTLTLLPPGFYEDLESALEVAINAERVSDPKGILSLCFRSESDDIGVPVITAHFKGADVKLQAVNTFARIEDDLVCLTMIPSSDVAIFGNLAQINFLVGYDLEERTVSFKPADCTEH